MNRRSPVVRMMGDRAILVDFPPAIDEALLEELLFLKERIQDSELKGKVEVINTYHSLLIVYPRVIEDTYSECEKVRTLIGSVNVGKKKQVKLYHLPVCYDPEFGLDLELIAREKELSIEEVIQLHTAPIYTIFFMGFLPGFLYLGGLDERLRISRKSQPRLQVRKGAVGIGEEQTGIYPQESPGGWQLLGNAPVPLFKKDEDPPVKVRAGDRIKFYGISLDEYKMIQSDVEQGNFTLKSEIYGS